MGKPDATGDKTILIRLCKRCGLVVYNPPAHDRFHEAMGLGPALYDSREASIAGL